MPGPDHAPIRQDRRSFLILLSLFAGVEAKAGTRSMLIHDFANRSLTSDLGTVWRAVSDEVMGGISKADVQLTKLDGRDCLRLTGDVRLENNGGFLQASLELAGQGGTLDASGFSGVRLVVRGNGEHYALHLRTTDATRPWQSYRARFIAEDTWRTIDLPFSAFVPHRLEAPFDPSQLRRLGLVAIGRAFTADLAVAEIHFTA